jgi:hypothetical protein
VIVRWLRAVRHWLFLQELADLDYRLRRVEHRLSLIHRLLDVWEDPTLVRAIETDLCRIVRMRQELARLYEEDR